MKKSTLLIVCLIFLSLIYCWVNLISAPVSFINKAEKALYSTAFELEELKIHIKAREDTEEKRKNTFEEKNGS